MLNYELIDERELVFSIAKIHLNVNDEYHNRMMLTVYKTLTLDTDCPQIGKHWMKIGFQGDDPKTDLRGVGMFGILQFLYFLDRYTVYAREILFYSNEDIHSFPMISLFFNFSYLALECLREGYLIPICNQQQSITITLNVFYTGLIDYFFTNYKNKSFIIDNIPNLLKTLTLISKDNPLYILSLSEELNRKYPEIKDSMTLNNINNE